ncbi:Uncharacterised protein [Chromobacterium violaceum]|uniref:Uncharacterized protein n=1 Tax=Chromobacterium violaceum TaxID=536 RepID=A0A447TEK3_CHRVL|nr:Uncharacterised protein [Chromobacterium violaceum]
MSNSISAWPSLKCSLASAGDKTRIPRSPPALAPMTGRPHPRSLYPYPNRGHRARMTRGPARANARPRRIARRLPAPTAPPGPDSLHRDGSDSADLRQPCCRPGEPPGHRHPAARKMPGWRKCLAPAADAPPQIKALPGRFHLVGQAIAPTPGTASDSCRRAPLPRGLLHRLQKRLRIESKDPSLLLLLQARWRLKESWMKQASKRHKHLLSGDDTGLCRRPRPSQTRLAAEALRQFTDRWWRKTRACGRGPCLFRLLPAMGQAVWRTIGAAGKECGRRTGRISGSMGRAMACPDAGSLAVRQTERQGPWAAGKIARGGASRWRPPEAGGGRRCGQHSTTQPAAASVGSNWLSITSHNAASVSRNASTPARIKGSVSAFSTPAMASLTFSSCCCSAPHSPQ